MAGVPGEQLRVLSSQSSVLGRLFRCALRSNARTLFLIARKLPRRNGIRRGPDSRPLWLILRSYQAVSDQRASDPTGRRGYDKAERRAAAGNGRSGRLGGDAEELLQVLAGDEPPPADLDVGQVPAAHLVIEQVAG